LQGYLFQLKDGKPVNLTEKTERLGISKLINGIPVAETVVYPAKGETKSHITVFTDTTCPYCHKLHAEVPELNKRGIEVRYVAFPRQGLGSPGDEQLQAVWCSSDKPRGMDKMVDGKEIKAAKCANPVSKQFQLGQSIGVNGTPAIVLADGQVIPGYQPAPQVAKLALAQVIASSRPPSIMGCTPWGDARCFTAVASAVQWGVHSETGQSRHLWVRDRRWRYLQRTSAQRRGDCPPCRARY
jgi:glutaredoxin